MIEHRSADIDPALKVRLLAVQSQIEAACRRVGRDPSNIRVIAVTKSHPLDTARKACALGLQFIGENKVQEALRKYEDGDLRSAFPQAKIHLIGHLQSNKVRKAVQIFDSIDSVDSVELAENLSRAAGEAGKFPRILLEVNTSKEPQKSGFVSEKVADAISKIKNLSHLKLSGLMTIGPNTDDASKIRNSFHQLYESFQIIKQSHSLPHWRCLSMGMSNDFEIAIEEGATEIRLGTILFGGRK